MKEILTMGDVTKDFNRLGITIRKTYQEDGCHEYGIYELTDEEFDILYNEPDDIEEAWEDCGWRYCEGSNQGTPNETLMVNGKELICWFDPSKYDEEYEDEEITEDEEPYKPEYNNLLEYLCDEMGCSQPRNVCALVKDLAKYNNMTMAELFKSYQG